MPKPYTNKEYIDWVREGNLLVDTVAEGLDRVTLPEKMMIRDMSVTVYGVFDSASVIVEYSPDQMETAQEDLVPAAMRWFSVPGGTFTAENTDVQALWKNLDAAEGWFRMRLTGVAAQTNLCIKTRPRVEQVISN